MDRRHFLCLLTISIHALWAARPIAAQTLMPGEGQVIPLVGPGMAIPSRDPNVAYNINLNTERAWVRLPKGAAAGDHLGLVVFVSPEDQIAELPPNWEKVLDRHKLIFAAPLGAGNDQPTDRRCGLAVGVALRLEGFCPIDPKRIYAAGFSGGARVAGQLGFYQSDLFRGTIQCSGADFPHPVPQVAPRDAEHATDAEYGRMPGTDAEVAAAKADVRFALITGSRDFRHGFIVDLFHGGFEKEGFQATLIDVPGMAHASPPASRLEEALAFVEHRPAPAAPAAQASAAWSTKPTEAWPQLLLQNSFKATSNDFDGASGFLVRLPSGQPLAVTARHVFGETLDVPSLEKPSTVWTMAPPARSTARVHLRKIAWDAERQAGGKPLDCVVMTVDEPTRWPAELLTPRQTPPVVGETVYLLGVPYGDKAAQRVYKGTVISEDDDESMFGYEIDGTPATRGFSGAPVVDANGLVLGIHHGKYDQQPDAGRLTAAAVDINAVMAAVRPPPGYTAPRPPTARPVPAASPQPAAPPHAPTVTTDDSERSAKAALEMAQNYITANRYDSARTKLQAIIDKYPKTSAAAQARQLLQSLPKN